MSTTTIAAFTGVPGAAEALGLHPETVRALIHRGELPAVRLGRQFRIKIADLEALTTA